MKKTKLLAGAVVAAIGGLAMTSIASATTTVTPLVGETVNYTLNGNEDFSAGVLQIDDGETKIFILDRNLGATEAGTGCDVIYSNNYDDCPADDPTYGYHFQWGNNYGFNPNIEPSTRTTQVQTTSLMYDPLHQHYYYSDSHFFWDNTFGSKGNWLDDDNKVDLWGGTTNMSTDGFDPDGNGNLLSYGTIDVEDYINGTGWQVTNMTERQGPCPDNFHIPSYGELAKIRDMLGDNYGIKDKLLLPLAGYRSSAYVDSTYLGIAVHLWTSSPSNSNSQYSQTFYLDTYDDLYSHGSETYRADALSIRCVHDSYQTYTKAGNLSGEQQPTVA